MLFFLIGALGAVLIALFFYGVGVVIDYALGISGSKKERTSRRLVNGVAFTCAVMLFIASVTAFGKFLYLVLL